MNLLPHIAMRAFNRPLLMQADYAATFFSALAPRLGAAQLSFDGVALDVQGMQQHASAYGIRAGGGDKSYGIRDGVAIIPIDGTLMHKAGMIGSNSGAMGYDGLAAEFKGALSDPTVRGIMLDIDSPGGEVSGVQALSDLISNSSKPVWAHANETAASAAYWLASVADKLMLSETASVGSVGVIMVHKDVSKAMDEAGYKVTIIRAGAHKADGNPYEPLPDDVKAALQVEAEDLRQLFAASVAAGRGMTTARVLETEARMYRGQAAVDIGLADKVMSFDAALAEFTQTLAKQGGFKQGLNMSKVTDTTATSAASADAGGEAVSMQTHLAALAVAKAEANAEGLKTGASAERERIAAVLNAPNAKGREATAQALALSTSMTAVEADAILATVAAAAPNTAKDVVREAALAGMAQAPGTKLASADAGNPNQPDLKVPVTLSASAVAAHMAAKAAAGVSA